MAHNVFPLQRVGISKIWNASTPFLSSDTQWMFTRCHGEKNNNNNSTHVFGFGKAKNKFTWKIIQKVYLLA